MSLTSLIKSDKELRNKISTAFLRPKIDKSKKILAAPLSKKYGLVGTAFDYIFRFNLERLNKSQDKSRIWVAEKALGRMGSNEEKHKIGIDLVNKVKELHNDFLITGDITEDLVKSVLQMSYLDPVFRAGQGVEYIGENAEKEDIEDIDNLISIIEFDKFIASSCFISNPTFGKASMLVGGADADIIIDDMLIDIKTTKNLDFNINYFCQLIGYLLLQRIGGIDGQKEEVKINKLGVYYSRFGYLFTFDVEDIIDSSSLIEVTDWFENRIKESQQGVVSEKLLAFLR